MFWYTKFHSSGAGLHGVKRSTGRNASHGCVRLTESDARWLNQSFIEVGKTQVEILEY